MDRKRVKKRVIIGQRYWFTSFGFEFEVEVTEPANMETMMCKVKYIKILNEDEVTGNVLSLLPDIKALISNGTITPMWVHNLRKL